MKPVMRVPLFLSLFLPGLVGVGLPNSTAINAQPQQATKSLQNRSLDRPSKHSGPLAKALFSETTDEDAGAQIRRQSRELRNKGFYRFLKDPGKFVEGEQETVVLRIYEFLGTIESLPVDGATTVILGTVENSKGFVSGDRTYVYSDYRVKVEEVLKTEQGSKLSAGAFVIVSRAGASVEFPSGHVRHFMIEKQGIPKRGAKYLFFLVRDGAEGFEYSIILGGAHELLNGRFYPLDDYNSQTEGLDAASLITKVKQLIGQPR